MTPEEQKKSLEALGEKLNEKMDAMENRIGEIEGAAKEHGDLPERFEGELKALKEAHRETAEEYKSLYEKADSAVNEMQAQIDELGTKSNRVEKETLKSHIHDVVSEKHNDLIDLMNQKTSHVGMELKADVTMASNFTNEVIDRDRIPGVWYDADRPVHIRDFMTIMPVSTDVIRWVSESAYTDNVSVTAEGSASSQTDFTLKSNDETIRRIDTHLTLSKEMLADAGFVESYVRTRVMGKIMNEEDDQILNGSGVAPNLNGLTNQAQAYVDNIADANVQRIDVLYAAGTGARVDYYSPNIALVHPNDYQKIALTKNGDNSYILPGAYTTSPIVINGATVVPNTAVTEGEFLVGDLRLACALAVRSGIEMTFTNSHASNFTKGFITIQVEERVGMPVYQSKALVYGTFTAALGDGTA